MKIFCLAALAFAVAVMPALACDTPADSLGTTARRAETGCSFTVPEIAVPVALTGLSAWAVGNGWLEKRKYDIQDALSAGGRHHIRIDEFTPYLPLAAVYGLNVCGVRGRHSYLDATIIIAMSYATMTAATYALKYTFRERRPDGTERNSFPSGHTATAFMAATALYNEFRDVSPWIGYGGYAVAALTGYLRIYNNRHYINDVIAGACIGYLSTKFAYWLFPRIFKNKTAGHSCATKISGSPFCSPEGAGMSLSISF